MLSARRTKIKMVFAEEIFDLVLSFTVVTTYRLGILFAYLHAYTSRIIA